MDEKSSLGTLSVTKFPSRPSKQMKRSASCASQFVSASRLPSASIARTCSTRTLSDSLQRYAPPQGVSNNEFIPDVFKASLSQPDLSLDPGLFVQRGYGAAGHHINIYRGNSRREQLLGASATLDRHIGRRKRAQSSGSTTSLSSATLDRHIG